MAKTTRTRKVRRPTPVRAIEARRIKATPELIANIRQRYEHSDERLATMAADLGCCGETVRAMAKREGWVRYVAPPRDLSPAARLRVRAEALAGRSAQASPESGRVRRSRRRRRTGGDPADRTPCDPAPWPSPFRGRERRADEPASGARSEETTTSTPPSPGRSCTRWPAFSTTCAPSASA